MSRRFWRMLCVVGSCLSVATPSLRAQGGVDREGRDQRPRFFFETENARVPLNVSHMPMLMRRIPLDLNDVPARDALNAIAARAGIELIYGVSAIDERVRIQLHVDEITVAGAMTEVLLRAGSDVDVVFTKPGRATLVKRREAARMTGVIAGRVTEQNTGTPIAAAHVTVEGKGIARYTNDKGEYRIPDVPPGDYTISARRLGFAPATRRVHVEDGQSASADFAMTRTATSLTEVVTTATGERSRLEVGNAIGTIKADSMVSTTLIRNTSDLLTARTPGVMVTNSSGLVGAPSSIRIRGVASVSLSNDPIIVLDGIRLTPATNAGLATNIGAAFVSSPQGFTGFTRAAPTRLDDIDPNTIESIDVLRGPSASSLYGTDAAAGVIVIKTKKGAAGPWRFNVLADEGASHVMGTFPLTWVGYGHLPSGAPTAACVLYNNGAVNVTSHTCVQDSIRTYQPLNDPRLTTLGTGTAQNVAVNLSGGTEQLREFLSLRVADAVGIPKLSDAEQDRIARMWGSAPPYWMQHPNSERNIDGSSRTNLRVNGALDLSLTANALYRNTLNGSSGTLNDGSIIPTGNAGGFYDTLLYLPAETQRARIVSTAKRGYGAATGNYTPFSWLVLHGTLGGDYTLRTDDGLGRASDCTTVLAPATGCPSGHSNTRGETFVTTVDIGAQATWTPRDWLSFRTSLGEQYGRTTYYSLTSGNAFNTNLAFGTDLLTPSPVATVAGVQLYTVTENRDESATAGWYLEETAALRERLFLTAAFREDVASAFGKNVNAKAPVYPKFSLSWVASDEPALASVFRQGFVSSFRLRAAYGHSGQEARQTAVLNNFQTGNTIVDGVAVPGIVLSGIGNPNLRPERTAEAEGGFDVSFLENERLRLEATVYRKLSNDAITTTTLGASYGIIGATGSRNLSQSINLGKVENRGWELTAVAKLLDSRMFAWQLAVNGSHNANKLISSATTTLPQIGSTGNFVGYPLGSAFGHPMLGYTDANGDGILEFGEAIFSKASVFMGATTPESELTYANAVSLWEGRVQVNATFDQVNGQTRGLVYISGLGDGAVRAVVDPTAPLADQAAVMQALEGGAGWRVKTNTFRFSELSVTWNLPKRAASGFLRAHAAALTFAGRNLALWTSYPGKDPNIGRGPGTDLINESNTTNSAIPQPLTWTFRVNLGY